MKSKKAITEIISTVLLIVIAIAMAGAVYTWMSFYVEKPLPEESCPEGVSFIIEQYHCEANTINITVQNRGLFDITGFSAKFNNETGNETSPELYGKYPLYEIETGNNTITFAAGLSSGERANFEFTFAGSGKIEQIELGPFKGYDNYSRPIFCEKAIVRQRISNCGSASAPPSAPSAVCGTGGCETGEDCLNCQNDCGKCANGHSCTSDSQCISNICNGNCIAAPTIACGDKINKSTTLTDNLTNCQTKGLIIGASGITLNCAGHSITGNNIVSSMGIDMNAPLNGVTIKNCVVNNFYYGLFMGGADSNNIINSNFPGTSMGAYLTSSNNNIFTNSKFSGPNGGIYLSVGVTGNKGCENTGTIVNPSGNYINTVCS